MPYEPFSYQLPEERIAQRPVEPREAARLLVLTPDRERGLFLEDSTFAALSEYLSAGDTLVLNNTRVRPARLFGRLVTGAQVELFLLESSSPLIWHCLGRPLKKMSVGTKLLFGDFAAEVVERTSDRSVLVRFFADDTHQDAEKLLAQALCMPIPPYIRSGRGDGRDAQDYQTVFAENEGSVAAPTAGLHFSELLLEQLKEKGVFIENLTLHVGAASFLPLYDEQTGTLQPPQAEDYVYSSAVLERLRRTQAEGGRVIAVGTTVVRALESIVRDSYHEGETVSTDLFIQPGFGFRLVDALITNFHQPGTSHMLLVEAFLDVLFSTGQYSGRDVLASSYAHALKEGYRFLSYGDGMLLQKQREKEC